MENFRPQWKIHSKLAENYASERNENWGRATLYITRETDFTESGDVASVSKVYGSQKKGTDDQRGTR